MTERQIPKTLDEAYALAAEAKPSLDAFGERLAKQFGCEFKSAPLKGRKRAEEKLSAKYRGDVSQLQDLARCRLICDSLEQVDAIKKAVKEYTMPIREADRMDKPNERGYRDLKYVFPEKNGFAVEMQIQLNDFAQADKETHRHYEKIRSITADAKDRPLTVAEQKEIAMREKICRGLYMDAALSFNKHATGRKLKIEQDKQPAALVMKVQNAKVGGR